MKWGLLMLYLMRLYLCGIFIYLYLSEIKIDYRAAIIGSIAGMFTGYNTTLLYLANSALAFYIPFGLWSIELIVQHQDSIKGYVILCLGFALAIFAGHPETLFYGTSIVLIYSLTRILQEYKQKGSRSKVFLKLFCFLIIGMLISCIQLIPFLEYMFHSYMFYIRAQAANLSAASLSSIAFGIIPDFFSAFLGNNNVIGYSAPVSEGYAGITILMLFVTGILVINKINITLIKAYFVIMVYIIVVSFNIPVLHGIVSILPGFKMGWNHYMFGNMPLFVIFIGAAALDAFFKGRSAFKHIEYAFLTTLIIVFAFLGILFITANADINQALLNKFYTTTLLDTGITIGFLVLTTFLFWEITSNSLLALYIGILVFAQTALPMLPFESAIKPAYFYPVNNIIEVLKNQPKPFRFLPALHSNEVGPPWPTGIATYYGFEDPNGYDALGIKWYLQLVKEMPADEFINLINVKYIIMTEDDLTHFKELNLKPMLSYNDYTLYENLSAFNRAFVVYDYKTAYTEFNDQNWLYLVKEYARQLNNTAVISEGDSGYTTFVPGNITPGAYNVQFENYKPSFIRMKVDTSEPGLLVISNTYFPGWHVYVDNIKNKLIRTDYAFDGVFLEKGNHTVVLAYKPLSFFIGLILTIAGVVGLILVSILL
jgi:Bacterial membrane protein YfhO